MTDLNDFNYTDGVEDVMAAYINALLASTMRSEYQNAETLSATRTLTDADTPFQRLNCNGANRIVKAPTADTVDNHPFMIVNSTSSGTWTLTVQNNGGTITHAVLNPSEFILMMPKGDGTYAPFGRPFSSVLTPAQITSNQNDYNPTGAGAADVLRISSDAARSITGLGFPAGNKAVVLMNVGSFSITLSNASVSSVAANRFAIGADFSLDANKAVLVIYDATSSRWRMVGGGGSSASAGMTKSIASVTTSNVTGVVGTQHILDVSGMTANRNFVLPAGTAGDEIEVDIAVGDDTYALILIGNTGITITGNGVVTGTATEWSRLFISGEKVRFVATSATNWLVSDDGRIKQLGVMERQTAQSISTGTNTKIQLATSITNIGNVVDNATNYRITVRRAGTYTITGFVSLDAGLDDQEIINLLIYKNGTFDRYLANYISAAAADKQSYVNLSYKKSLAAADYIELYVNHNEGAAVNTNTSNYPQLSVVEDF